MAVVVTPRGASFPRISTLHMETRVTAIADARDSVVDNINKRIVVAQGDLAPGALPNGGVGTPRVRSEVDAAARPA